jgi:hypothetical protein
MHVSWLVHRVRASELLVGFRVHPPSIPHYSLWWLLVHSGGPWKLIIGLGSK